MELGSPVLQADSVPAELPGKPCSVIMSRLTLRETWTAAHQASLSLTVSWSLPRFCPLNQRRHQTRVEEREVPGGHSGIRRTTVTRQDLDRGESQEAPDLPSRSLGPALGQRARVSCQVTSHLGPAGPAFVAAAPRTLGSTVATHSLRSTRNTVAGSQTPAGIP